MNIEEDSDLFKKNVKELQDGIEKEYGPDKVESITFRRFLTARDCNVKQAYLMLTKSLEWRKQNHVDTIFEDFKKTELFENYLPVNWLGLADDGPNVCLICCEQLDVKGYAKSTIYEDYFQHLIYLIEKGYIERRGEGKLKKLVKEEKTTVIIDGNGLQMSDLTSRKVIEYAIHICIILDSHYPECLKALYFINSSVAIQLLFNIVKPFISTKTKGKMHMYGKDGWKEALVKVIDPKILPAYLGGEMTDPDGNPMCYSFICHGGTIPERLYLKNSTLSEFRNQPGVQSFVIKRKSKFDLPFQITLGGSSINWDFEVDNYDIEFGLFYKTSDAQDDDELQTLIPLKRSSPHIHHGNGLFKCENPGIYILTWDNMYSFFRSKVIYYKILVVDPDQD